MIRRNLVRSDRAIYPAPQRLIAARGDLSGRDDANGATYLHVAASNGYNDVVLLLARQGAAVDVNAEDHDGNTPLHLAAFFEQYEVVMHLVSNGANLLARNRLAQKVPSPGPRPLNPPSPFRPPGRCCRSLLIP